MIDPAILKEFRENCDREYAALVVAQERAVDEKIDRAGEAIARSDLDDLERTLGAAVAICERMPSPVFERIELLRLLAGALRVARPTAGDIAERCESLMAALVEEVQHDRRRVPVKA